MRHISQTLPTALESLKQLKPQSSKDSALSLKDDDEGKKDLAVILSQCFDTMKLYGKEPGQLKSTASLFQLTLSDFPIGKIRDAFRFYLQNYTDMPTPADICNIMKRGNKPPLDRSVYVSISKKDPELRNSADWAYMREYEEFQIHGE